MDYPDEWAKGYHVMLDTEERLSRKIAQAPVSHLPMIEKIVEDLLDGLKRAG